MYICIYVYMYICIYVYMYICIYVYTHIILHLLIGSYWEICANHRSKWVIVHCQLTYVDLTSLQGKFLAD